MYLQTTESKINWKTNDDSQWDNTARKSWQLSSSNFNKDFCISEMLDFLHQGI